MTSGRFAGVRSWLGITAAAIAILSGGWMAAEFVRAKSVESADKARIEALKERARTDGTIHKTLLQPEFDRQREAMARRHRVYRAAGPVALVSLAVFLAWVRWFRPGPGQWVGTPRALQSLLGGTLDHPST